MAKVHPSDQAVPILFDGIYGISKTNITQADSQPQALAIIASMKRPVHVAKHFLMKFDDPEAPPIIPLTDGIRVVIDWNYMIAWCKPQYEVRSIRSHYFFVFRLTEPLTITLSNNGATYLVPDCIIARNPPPADINQPSGPYENVICSAGVYIKACGRTMLTNSSVINCTQVELPPANEHGLVAVAERDLCRLHLLPGYGIYPDSDVKGVHNYVIHRREIRRVLRVTVAPDEKLPEPNAFGIIYENRNRAQWFEPEQWLGCGMSEHDRYVLVHEIRVLRKYPIDGFYLASGSGKHPNGTTWHRKGTMGATEESPNIDVCAREDKKDRLTVTDVRHMACFGWLEFDELVRHLW